MKVEVKMDGRGERKRVRKREEGRETSRGETRNSNHLGLLLT